MKKRSCSMIHLSAADRASAFNGTEKWYKSAQSAHGNHPLNSSESGVYSELLTQVGHPPFLPKIARISARFAFSVHAIALTGEVTRPVKAVSIAKVAAWASSSRCEPTHPKKWAVQIEFNWSNFVLANSGSFGVAGGHRRSRSGNQVSGRIQGSSLS